MSLLLVNGIEFYFSNEHVVHETKNMSVFYTRYGQQSDIATQTNTAGLSVQLHFSCESAFGAMSFTSMLEAIHLSMQLATLKGLASTAFTTYVGRSYYLPFAQLVSYNSVRNYDTNVYELSLEMQEQSMPLSKGSHYLGGVLL